MKRASDHAMLLVHRARQAERRYAQSKNVRDLTEVIKFDKIAKDAVNSPRMPVETMERKGIPIGQRWA